MSVFINHFGITLRNSLHSSMQREAELKQEIAHRKQMEEQVNVLNMKLQQQVSELERFTYTVSHDLRNPLVTIKGFLGVLEKDLREQKMDRIQSDFQRIAKATDKMNILLSELLELSRVGRIVNPPEEIDTNRLIQDAIESVHARLRSRNAAILVPPDMPTLYGDHIRLREVFENLLDNAVKYMGDQTDPKIEIGVRDQAGASILYVKDNGMGIEEQYKEKIFGLFEKLNPTIEGTGVGLALVKRIIETHGGKIWVESDGLGEGSTFCFTIPDDGK
jgi:signal transduction histidine kinase